MCTLFGAVQLLCIWFHVSTCDGNYACRKPRHKLVLAFATPVTNSDRRRVYNNIYSAINDNWQDIGKVMMKVKAYVARLPDNLHPVRVAWGPHALYVMVKGKLVNACAPNAQLWPCQLVSVAARVTHLLAHL